MIVEPSANGFTHPLDAASSTCAMLNSALILKLISMYLLYNHKGEERGFVVSKSLGLNIWETNYGSKSMIPSQIGEVCKWSVTPLAI